MKRLYIFAAFILLSGIAHSQIRYMYYVDSAGYTQIATVKTPQVAISGYYNNLTNLPAINVSITRPINSTTFTVSTTRTAIVFYNISISCTASIGGASAGSVTLQYSLNGGTTWIPENAIANSQTVTLAITLNSVSVQSMVLCGIIPPGALVRLVSASSGTTVMTYLTGIEYY